MTEHILVADDAEAILDAVADALAMEGFQVARRLRRLALAQERSVVLARRIRPGPILDGAVTPYLDLPTMKRWRQANTKGVGMNENLDTKAGVAERESLVTSLEIEVLGRWDALALSETLVPYHSFLVQFDRQRWVVHARVPGCHGESLDGALAKIEEWLADRSLVEVSCRIDGQPYELYPEKGRMTFPSAAARLV